MKRQRWMSVLLLVGLVALLEGASALQQAGVAPFDTYGPSILVPVLLAAVVVAVVLGRRTRK